MILRKEIFDCGCGYAISQEAWLRDWRKKVGIGGEGDE